ncbi:MAG: ABC transporter substrate-binding protein [Vicinamibacterales bacterium]
MRLTMNRCRGLAAVLVVATLAAGCGGGSERAATARPQMPLPAEPAVTTVSTVGTYGGRFVIGQISAPRTFNPFMANEVSSSDVTNRMYTALTGFDNETQESEPALAKTWSVADDKVTWTFNLRQGALFSDGKPMTSADVLFSFQIAYDDKVHPSVQDLLLMDGKRFEITAPDAHTVVIKTPSPNAMLVSLASSVPIVPKHVLGPALEAGTFETTYTVDTPPDQLITSGPFRLKQYLPGEKTVIEPNPYWFGVDQANNRLPYLDEVVYLIVPDQDAVDLKFRAGEIDGMDQVKPENFGWYQDNQAQGNFTLHTIGPELSTHFFWFNLARVRKPTEGRKLGEPYASPTKYAWFNDPVFRRAVSMAVDRESMIPSVFYGQAVKNWSTTTPGNKVWYTPDIVKYDYNLAESKRLLASLGWKDGNGDGVLEDTKGNPVSFTLKTNSNNTLRVAMANFIRDDLAKVGIKVNLVPLDFNTIITNLRDDFQYDAILLGLQSGVPPDPAMGQNVWRSSGRTHNWNPNQPKPDTPEEARIDALVDILVAEPDLAVRKKAWTDIQNIVNDQSWMIWLPTQVAKLPLSNRFGNALPSVIPHRLLWNIDRVYVKARANDS